MNTDLIGRRVCRLSARTEIEMRCSFIFRRFPASLIGVAAGGLPGAGAGVEGIVAGSLPLAHAIAPVSHPPHTPSPGQPSKAEADRDIPSDQ